MTTYAVLFQLTRADLLERVRRPSFPIAVGSMLVLAWEVAGGRVTIRLGRWTGEPTADWIGAIVSLVATTLLPLVGFYLTKNTIERDRVTRVAEIIATTPLTARMYVAGKSLSNLLYLLAMAGALAAGMLLFSRLGSEPTEIDLGAASALLVLAIPALALTASLAVFFETVRWLSGGVGNIIYPLVWAGLLATPLATSNPYIDVSGVTIVGNSIRGALVQVDSAYLGRFVLTIAHGADQQALSVFRWEGVTWTSGLILSRLAICLSALALVLGAANRFDRFQADAEAPTPPRDLGAIQAHEAGVRPANRSHVSLPSLDRSALRYSFSHALMLELKLMLNGRGAMWWLATAGVSVAAPLLVPLEVGRLRILALSWIWPVLIWSELGSREARHGTAAIVFATPHVLRHQLAIAWSAGFCVALAAGAIVGVRLLAAGDVTAVVALLTAAAFIPSLALACGVWTGGSRTFEALYALLWYAGPMQAQPVWDFIGTRPGTFVASSTATLGGIAVALVLLAFLGRWRQASA